MRCRRIMGTAMIRNLLGGGHDVAVYNRTAEKARALEADGAIIAATPREAAAGADAVISIVTDDAASRACWTGADDFLREPARPRTAGADGDAPGYYELAVFNTIVRPDA